MLPEATGHRVGRPRPSLVKLAWGVVAGLLLIGLGYGLYEYLWGDPIATLIDRACIGGCTPGESGHWLGTDSLGRDVAAQLAGGAATALLGGLLAAGGSLFIGYVLGAGAAWLSRGGRQVPWWLWLFGLAGIGYLGFTIAYGALSSIHVQLIVLLLASVLVGLILWWERQNAQVLPAWVGWGVQADRVLVWWSEVVSSVPALLLLLALASLALRPSLGQLILIYVAVRWPAFAVLALQESRAVLHQPYVLAAHAGGIGTKNVIFHHVLPNTIGPMLVKGILAVGGFILVEGTFAFLGLGLPVEQPSWGRVLAEAQQLRGAWWLWVFPGLALFASLLSLQVIGLSLKPVSD